MYDSERADARALEQLEAILRDVAEELSSWRARALKAESDAKGGRGGATHTAAAARNPEVEAENRALRQRVEAARTRVQGLLARLAFLEEQARTPVAGAGGGGGGS
jgi:uncharacterized protein involved in exopolysaccharide biosynthesis